MRWLIRSLDNIFDDQGTTVLRRLVMALAFGSVVGFLCLLRSQSKPPMNLPDMALSSLGIGVLAVLVAALLHLAGALWRRGAFARLIAIFLFIVGVVFLVGAVCAALCTIAGV